MTFKPCPRTIRVLMSLNHLDVWQNPIEETAGLAAHWLAVHGNSRAAVPGYWGIHIKRKNSVYLWCLIYKSINPMLNFCIRLWSLLEGTLVRSYIYWFIFSFNDLDNFGFKWYFFWCESQLLQMQSKKKMLFNNFEVKVLKRQWLTRC